MTDDIKLPNEYGFEQWYVTNAFDYPQNPLGSQECGLQRKAWHAAISAVHEELRKQEPVAYTFKQEGSPAYTNNPSFMKLNTQYVYEPLYAAPIPPTGETK